MYEKVWNKWFLKLHVINTINITTPISIQWRLTFTFYEHIQSQPNSSANYDTFQKSVPNISNWKLCGRQLSGLMKLKYYESTPHILVSTSIMFVWEERNDY